MRIFMPVDVTEHSTTSGSGFWTIVLGGMLLALILTSRPSETGPSEAPPDPEKDTVSRAPTSPELEISARRALEPGRGRSANAPIEIPIRGWKDIFWRTWDAFNRDRVLSVAAGVTFYVLLALFPALAALVSLYGFFADRATVGEHLGLLSGVFPDGAVVVIRDQVERIAGQKSSLGFAFFGSLAVSLWTANAGMKGLFEAMNVV